MDNTIIVKNLPRGIFVPELCDLFKGFGRITSAAVHGDEGTNVEAAVVFEENFGAQEAVKRMNRYKFKNKTLRVLMSNETELFTKVFVKNFSPSWSHCDLLKAFEGFGTVENVKISEDKGISNGYGYVIFKNHFTAKRAIEGMNGKEINGHKLQVERFQSKTEIDYMRQNSLEYVEEMLQRSVQLNNLHVKNLPADFTEDELKNFFRRFGEVSSVKIVTDREGISKGFGFVSFTEKENAAKAKRKMDGHTLKGKKMQVSFKEDGQLRKQYMYLKNKAREVEIQWYRQRSQSVPKMIHHSLSYGN